MQEQELFERYELKGWQFSPRLYKIIGASVVVNLVWFVLLAQANFLTGKTCDSPIASGVCSVLDTLYVGGMILDTDSTFVDKPYEKTEIGDADEITYINVGDYKPLEYPVGYFALANPDQQLDAMGNPIITSSEIPGISTSPTDLMNVNPTLPQNNGSVLDEPLPTNPLGNITQGKTINKKPKVPKTSPTELPKIDGDNTADTKTTSDPVKLGEINKKPFEDLGDDINAKLEKNEIDLTKTFTVVMEATINADGKFDPKKTKFIKSEGDEQMVKAARSALTAMGDSGFLGQLKQQGIDKVNITLVQDENQIYAIVLSDMKTPEKAATTASGLNFALSTKKLLDNNSEEKDKLDDTTRVLLNNSTITSTGKIFRLDFKLPKNDALVIIKQTLDKRAEKKSQQLNSSGEVNNNTGANTAK